MTHRDAPVPFGAPDVPHRLGVPNGFGESSTVVGGVGRDVEKSLS